MADTVVEQVAERLDIPTSEARLVLNALSKLIHQQAEQEGRVRVPGIGIFEQKAGDEALRFTPDAALERVVNHRYAGMAPAASAPPAADASSSEAEHTGTVPPIAVEASEEKEAQAADPGATSAEETPAEGTREADAPGEDAAKEATSERGVVQSSQTTPAIVAASSPGGSDPDGEEETAPPAPERDGPDDRHEPEGTDDADAPTDGAAAEVTPSSDAPDESRDGGDGAAEPVTEQAAPNRTPALIGLLLALLLAAGAAWWLLTDEPADPPGASDVAVMEPEPADETDQPAPDPATDPEAADETSDAADVPDEERALTDGVSPDDLPAGADAIDPTLGGFALVVASVPSEEDAEAIEADYRDAVADDPLPTALLVLQSGDTTRYRVGIGQFATQDEALAVRDARSDVLPGDAWVLRLTPDMARN